MYNNQQERRQGHQNNNNNGGNNAKAYEPLKLEVEPIPFDGLLKSKLTDTMELSRQVNALLKPVMVDFEGSIILPNQFGQLEVSLFFKDKGVVNADGKIKTLIPVTERHQGGSAIDRILKMNTRNSSKSYDISKESKEILSDFFYTRGNAKVKWEQHVFEQTEQNYNGYTIYVKVVGLDLVRILKKIYGGKSQGAIIDYMVSVIKPVGINNAGANQNYLINIQQLDSKEVEKLATKIGIIPTTGNIQMVR